ncbi:MAG: amidohydrolase [Vicinamibacterales bacterium]|nr:amidohydrolase [Vicinamibacterales bacterium]
MRQLLIAGGILCVLAAAPLRAQESVDLLLHNGKIFTADELLSTFTAVAVRDDRIVALGWDGLLDQYRAVRTVDLDDKLVVPGFIDTHIHISGDPERWVDLAGLENMAELKARVTRKAEQLGSGEWITGYGWSEDELAERRRPLRWDLDDAAPVNPVVLTRAGGHSSVANSLALEAAGLTPQTETPPGAIIEVDDQGRMNGILREGAQGLVRRFVPDPTSAELRDSFVQNLRNLLGLGITSLIQAGVGGGGFASWEEVYAEFQGELPRAAVQVRVQGPAERAIETLTRFGRKTGDGNEWLRVGPVKFFVDGGYTGAAAWTLEPYKGQPGYFGTGALIDADGMYRLSKAAHEMGWQMGFHTIGDAAIKMTVDAWSRVIEESPRVDHRHYLNHFTVRPPAETMQKMASHNIHIAQQPNFTYTLEGRYAEHLEGERYETNNPVRSPMSHGVFVALGSDILPIGPMVGLYAAVTRKGMSGAVVGPGEALTMPEAIVAYTRLAAYLTFEEDIKGSLEVGKLADMVVLSQDLLTIDPDRTMDTAVEMTILGGTVVYQR